MPRHVEVEIAIQLGMAMQKLGASRDQAVQASWRGDRLYKIFEQLGAKSDLLGIVGSYGDTQPDEWVLDQLLRWNAQH